jgi:hypothetical protein
MSSLSKTIRISLVVAGVGAATDGCHKAQLEQQAQQECEELGRLSSWDEWDEHFGCVLLKRRDFCKKTACGEAGCWDVYPACGRTTVVGAGGHLGADGWASEWEMTEAGESGDPSPANTAMLELVRRVHFVSCGEEHCTATDEDHEGQDGRRCPICLPPPAWDRTVLGTRCCVEVEVGTGTSVNWRFEREVSWGYCGLPFHPEIPQDAGSMDPRTMAPECSSDLGVPPSP